MQTQVFIKHQHPPTELHPLSLDQTATNYLFLNTYQQVDRKVPGGVEIVIEYQHDDGMDQVS